MSYATRVTGVQVYDVRQKYVPKFGKICKVPNLLPTSQRIPLPDYSQRIITEARVSRSIQLTLNNS